MRVIAGVRVCILLSARAAASHNNHNKQAITLVKF